MPQIGSVNDAAGDLLACDIDKNVQVNRDLFYESVFSCTLSHQNSVYIFIFGRDFERTILVKLLE